MGFDAHVLTVLIASPSDTTRERDAIEKALMAPSRFPARYKTRRTPALNNFQAQTAPRLIAK